MASWDSYQMYFPSASALHYPGYPTPLTTPLHSPSTFPPCFIAPTVVSTTTSADEQQKKKSRRYKTPSPQVLRIRRSAANERERRRMNTLNVAYDKLRVVLPETDAGRRLSKFETLQMAQEYIANLAKILNSGGGGPAPLTPSKK